MILLALKYVDKMRHYFVICRGDPAKAGRPLRPERSAPPSAGPHPSYFFRINLLKASPPLSDFRYSSLLNASLFVKYDSSWTRMNGTRERVERCFPELWKINRFPTSEVLPR
jgi:hypothetical protein